MFQKQHPALFCLPRWLVMSINLIIAPMMVLLSAWFCHVMVNRGNAQLHLSLALFAAFICALWVLIPVSKLLNINHRWKFLISELFSRISSVYLIILVITIVMTLFGANISFQFLILWFVIGTETVLVSMVLAFYLALYSNIKIEPVKCVMVAINEASIELARRLRYDDWVSIDIEGIFEDRALERCPPCPDLAVLGKCSELGAYVKAHQIERVYIALPQEAQFRRQQIINLLLDSTVDIFFVYDFIHFKPIRARSELICGVPTYSISETPSSELMWIVKGVLDKLMALIGLLLISPLLLLTALAIKLDSKGRYFFDKSAMA